MLLSGDDRAEVAATIRAHHYTRSVPSGKSHYVRFEDALVVWSIPANRHLARFVMQGEGNVWELSRLWVPDGHRPNLLTEAISHAVRVLRSVEEVDAVVSYADPRAHHDGTVYRAASWRYHGRSETRGWRGPGGEIVPRRRFHSGDRSLAADEVEALGYVRVKVPGKIRFVRPLSRRAKRRIVWPAHDEHRCVECGGRRRNRRRYCSARCERVTRARKARQRRAAARRPASATCGHCSEVFAATRRDARYCSGRCRVAAYRSRRRRPEGDLHVLQHRSDGVDVGEVAVDPPLRPPVTATASSCVR